MEKAVNEIYNLCDEKLTARQIERLAGELEALAEIKYEQEDAQERKNNPYYWEDRDPYMAVQRENCNAL